MLHTWPLQPLRCPDAAANVVVAVHPRHPAPPHPVLACSVIFCEAVAIYGVIVAIILQTKIEYVTPNNGVYDKYAMASGYSIFGSGLTCGFANLVCG